MRKNHDEHRSEKWANKNGNDFMHTQINSNSRLWNRTPSIHVNHDTAADVHVQCSINRYFIELCRGDVGEKKKGSYKKIGGR